MNPGGGGSSLVVQIQTKDGVQYVLPKGDVDMTASPTLRTELKKAQSSRPQRLIIDLTGVPYMDSSGVATLVEAMQIARKNSTRMVLCGMTDKVRSIFEIARLDTVFVIAETAEAAALK